MFRTLYVALVAAAFSAPAYAETPPDPVFEVHGMTIDTVVLEAPCVVLEARLGLDPWRVDLTPYAALLGPVAPAPWVGRRPAVVRRAVSTGTLDGVLARRWYARHTGAVAT